jgi:ribonuclease BN (tRNA processing enzyme)
MKVRVLGCSGGIGGQHLRTTSLLVDDDILIDAGTGVGDLSIAELVRIEHVFVTHSHLDHVAWIPFIVDAVGDLRERPLVLHGLPETLAALHEHIFNWTIWPDFTALPSRDNPYLRFETITTGESIEIAGRRIDALPANHTVPAVGYRLDSGTASLVFTGDTATSSLLWAAINESRNLRYLLIETTFSDSAESLAITSKHLCPRLLLDALELLKYDPEIFITHLKPGHIEQTMAEIEAASGDRPPSMLQANRVFEL